jgi:hypothetical protein
MLGEHFAQQHPMFLEDVRVCICLELFEQRGRALDVGADEGDGAGRKVAIEAHRSAARDGQRRVAAPLVP